MWKLFFVQIIVSSLLKGDKVVYDSSFLMVAALMEAKDDDLCSLQLLTHGKQNKAV